MQIINYSTSSDHVSKNTVGELEDVIIADREVKVYKINKIKKTLSKVLVRLTIKPNIPNQFISFLKKTK